MVRAFGKLIAPYARRIYLMIGRGVVRMVDDSGALQRVQLTVLEGETRSELERFGEYGLASHAPAGAEAVTASVTGSRDHTVIIAVEHRRYRMKSLESGEVALYDDQGQTVHLTREGIVVKSEAINLGGEREALKALIDDRILELFNTHTHPVSGSSTAPPTRAIAAAEVCTTVVKAK